MKIDLHNLLTISLWEEEYSSLILRERSLIILNKEGGHKTIKFPAALKEILRKAAIEDSSVKPQEDKSSYPSTDRLKEPRKSSKLPQNITHENLQERQNIRQTRVAKKQEEKSHHVQAPFTPIMSDLKKLNSLIKSLTPQSSTKTEEQLKLALESEFSFENYLTELDPISNFDSYLSIRPEKPATLQLNSKVVTLPCNRILRELPINAPRTKEKHSSSKIDLQLEEQKNCKLKLKSGFFHKQTAK